MYVRTRAHVAHTPGALQANGDVFAHRGADWATARLPNYDSAFNFAARPSEADDDPFAAPASSVADEAHDPGAGGFINASYSSTISINPRVRFG